MKLYLSQSMLKEFETMCPFAFKHRWFGNDQEKRIFDRYSDAMKRGVLFETLAIGMGLAGKTAKKGDVPEKSVYYERIVRQAKMYKEWERANGFEPVGTQLQVQVKIEWEGGTYFAQGNIDRLVRDRDGILTVIDLKLTGDKDNDYGQFQFGRPDKVDYTQLHHYRDLVKHRYEEEEVRQMFYVADCSPKEGTKPLELITSPHHEYEHRQRCQTAYNEIVSSMITGEWLPRPTKNECQTCPLNDPDKLFGTGIERCKFARSIPEIEIFELY